MFLKNAWYPALWSKDLADKPVGRVYLNEAVVLFRDAQGNAVALEDRCCHRAAPLSLGRVMDGLLQCNYHGLKYDGTGACVEIPGQARIPSGAKVRAYPLYERWNVVWIWMGEPALADPGKIIDLPWLDDPAWAITPGTIHVHANYQLLVDNLLDVTHVAYLHRNTLAGDPRDALEPTTTERLDNAVRVGRFMLEVNPPPLFAKAGGFNGRVDRWQIVTWNAPSVVYLDVGCATAGTGAPQGDRSQGISIWSNHLLTPETETSTHYMFSFARNFGVADEKMSQMIFEGTQATFLEDVEMLEAQQKKLQGGRLERTVDLIADNAQLQARRMMDELLKPDAMERTV
jgi:phenylpropionate dioxygenase-like ring-hydroxylating dioxygenase large terminal subunit